MKKLFIVLLISFLVPSCTPTPPDGFNAYLISQTFAKQQLTDPEGAVFVDALYVADDNGDSTFRVKAVVDAKNAFGGTVRKSYVAKLRYKGGAWEDVANWQLISLQFD